MKEAQKEHSTHIVTLSERFKPLFDDMFVGFVKMKVHSTEFITFEIIRKPLPLCVDTLDYLFDD